ncbi:Rpn family recombination-promoting nuclease/putative transposase [Limnofasciculus baicalensis]|uniref:Rpn family recombination-promoting nuclease/putative transposase n=1 Tax=Limnofasciculus baicalensis BBK-W-15 TaxID=2699891 RepID=A0AAE3GW04_9CYAN|nr:Rpn family recombination-promoting nuclease/putative transposase [Limnofasciculus baicalensis]MCP2731067.1 Rpn family recombination-promoting nuclease/putative transposase [Limnofasciculus baicalensis BBK-W-15]
MTIAFYTQLKSGQGYSKLNPVIALTITDFEMFANRDKVISHFAFADMDDSFVYRDKPLEMVFVELPKFKKELGELESLTDKWIYFMKQSSTLEAIPETMGAIPEIEKAMRIANLANLSLEELEDVEKEQMLIEDRRGEILKGKEEGLQEGQVRLIIRQLERRLGAIDPDTQTRISELSIEQLENLGEALLDFSTSADLIAWLPDGNK